MRTAVQVCLWPVLASLVVHARSCAIVLAILAALLAGGCGGVRGDQFAWQPLTPAAIEASGYESKDHGGWADFPPQLAADDDLDARSSWRAEIADPARPPWLRLDLGRTHALERVGVAFVQGDARQYIFSIAASGDGEDWTTIFDGRSSGRTADIEYFDLPATLQGLRARYVRITGLGNTSEKFPNWINVTEVVILGR